GLAQIAFFCFFFIQFSVPVLKRIKREQICSLFSFYTIIIPASLKGGRYFFFWALLKDILCFQNICFWANYIAKYLYHNDKFT
ncbi:MAG: hypothetical protein ACLTBZ_00005, partial [Faecalispora jeddahensis]|uniref:hypothetical protein n=1 Tax=Faecalispora jeddahensis TaxID=1414721 RepID=UPI0039944C8E